MLFEINSHFNNSVLFVLNQVPLIEDVWKSDSITPRVPDVPLLLYHISEEAVLTPEIVSTLWWTEMSLLHDAEPTKYTNSFPM